mmetsp:Transcript_22281/g.68570  ORF Transcript_22281/g.68570 Transcript_22281/m.68570 type:complete len:268 (+) Transcript_22281:31-834(+)
MPHHSARWGPPTAPKKKQDDEEMAEEAADAPDRGDQERSMKTSSRSTATTTTTKKRVRVLDVKESCTKDVEFDYATPSARVQGLMEAVEATFGVPANRQRLICSGRMMRASELVGTYKLKGNTIHLFPRAHPVGADDAEAPHATATTRGGGPPEQESTGLVRRPLADDDALSRLALFEGNGDPDLTDVERGVFEFRNDPVDLGTPREFLWGFVMGFLLGFIMLLYLWERSASHRQKMGILAGATAQLLVKYIHAGLLASQGTPNSPN